MLIGRELTRIFALPRNPDDDCQFLGRAGPARRASSKPLPSITRWASRSTRSRSIRPARRFPPGGVAAGDARLPQRRRRPGFDKDSRLTFDPPADGAYIVRVADVRGLGGTGFGYHLVVRRPRPDFALSVSPENPNIPRGGHSARDGDSSRGWTASTARWTSRSRASRPGSRRLRPGSTPGETTALLALSGRRSAPAYLAADLEGDRPASSGDSASRAVRHEIDPGGPNGGRITVTPRPKLDVTRRSSVCAIRPGEQVEMTLTVARGAAFSGRVPIDVRNLPQGVRVLNIGLNGVLVTETQRERTITLYAEPWAAPMERPFFAVGNGGVGGDGP